MIQNKGKNFVFYSFLSAILLSCSGVDYSQSYDQFRVSMYGPKLDRFSFSISSEFVQDNLEEFNSYSITSFEKRILFNILQKNNYCIDKDGSVSYKILSRHRKEYDLTFSSLIEQIYTTKSVTPIIYFGVCR